MQIAITCIWISESLIDNENINLCSKTMSGRNKNDEQQQQQWMNER